MNRVLDKGLRKGVLLILLLSGLTTSADIVYPARLQLTETAPGVFEVSYILPVIQGKILKAQAVFPGFCESLTDPVTEVDAYQKKMYWQIGCGANALTGQQIGIEGLLGSQIDIILEITTLEGRMYKSTLSPAKAYYTIPEAPGMNDFLKSGTLDAGRYTLLAWGLFLMSLAYFLPRTERRPGPAVLVLTVGMSLGYYLSWSEALLAPSWAGPVIALLVTALLASAYIYKQQATSSGAGGIVLLGLAAAILGAGFRKGELLSGYTRGEEMMLLGFVFLGFLAGAWLLVSIARQLWRVLELWIADFRVPASKVITGVALGMLLWELSLFWKVPSMLPSIPPGVISLALVLAFWYYYSGDKRFFIFVIPGFLAGYAAGGLGFAIPYAWAALLGLQAFLLMLIWFKKSISPIMRGTALVLAGFSGGNYLQSFASDSLSYPLARSVFFLLLLTVLSLALALLLVRIKNHNSRDRILKSGSAVLLGFCLLIGLGFLRETYELVISPAFSAGFLPLPVVSILLLALALLFWPRHGKMLQKMDVKRKAPVFSVAALLFAFFLLPVHFNMKNPWYSTAQMNPEDVHRIVENKLLNTYTAFNIADEETLFERLNENLEEGLLDHIYLDSRRRLNMGLREGSTVTVKEVDLGDLGDPLAEGTTVEGMRYPATWTVTAQVKHLKHIHYRKNKYTGTIALKSIDNTWKISEITLISEDREVIASSRL